MDPALPPALRDALDRLAEGRSGRELAARAAEISRLYRAGKPSSLAIRDEADALAYALTRMPATYASVRAALERLAERAPAFEPRTVADIGCGPGTASWAAMEAFDTLEGLHLVDGSRPLLALGSSLLKEADATATANFCDLAAWRADTPCDLVVAAYVLTEMSDAAALSLAQRLWASTGGALVIVEPGTPAGWARLMAIRASLIEDGAAVAAPCPHHAPCPLNPPDWCHFAQRLPRSRAHRAMKGAELAYEDEKYAYLALARPGVALEPARPRVLAHPVEDKAALSLKLCEPVGALALRRIAKRDKEAFRAVRRAGWGDAVS